MCVCVCFCLSKAFPTSLPLPLQPLSREVKARYTQTHPDAFNLSKWVTSVHMCRFLAWTMAKSLAFYFGQKVGLLTPDPKVTSRGSQEFLQACQRPGFGSPSAQREPSLPQGRAGAAGSTSSLGVVNAPLLPAGPEKWCKGKRGGRLWGRDRGLAA